jgi:plasmid stabilization system protein ParE
MLQLNSQPGRIVPERRSRRLEVRLTRTAQRDVKAIPNWSRKEFGETAAARYKALIKQALRDIGVDPERPGSTERPEILIEGARTYHLWFSRGRVKGQGVKAPRHFLLYRRREEQAWATGSADASRDLPAERNGGKRPGC